MSDLIEILRSVFLRPLGDFKKISTVLIDLERMKIGIPGDITLKKQPREGIPIDRSGDVDGQKRISFENLSLSHQDGRLRGAATLSLEGDAPWVEPLKINVNLKSAQISRSEMPLIIKSQGSSYKLAAQTHLPEAHLRGQVQLSVITYDWVLHVHYDNKRVANAVEKAMAHRGQDGTVGDLADQFRYPGLDLSAVFRVTLPFSLPLLGKEINLSEMSFSAPTTRPLRNPLPGAVFPMPHRYRMSGLGTLMRPGILTDVWTPALWGYSRADFDETRGSSLSLALVPSINADGASLLEKFPLYGYLEYYRIHKISDGLELGFRFSLSPSSLDLTRLRTSSKQDEDVLMQYKDYIKGLEDNARLSTIANFEVLGRHNWF